MRKNSVIALSVLTIMMAMLVLPVSAAKKMEHKANGKVTEYASYPPGPHSSEVVGGNWNLRVKDGKVDFRLFYKEMNLIPDEEGGAPVGSVDLFKITFKPAEIIGTPPFEIDEDGTWVITGDFNIDKLAVQPDGSKVWIYGFFGTQGGAVHIYPDGGLALDAGPWHLLGSIKSMK